MLDIHAESDIKDTQVATGELEKKKAKNKFQKGNTFGRGSRQKKESLSLPNYIKRKTKDGKMLTDFHTGIINAVDDSDEDNPPVYKGMKISAELSTKAVDWLSRNGFGNPGQRKVPDEKPKRTETELKHRLRFLIKKLVKDEDDTRQIVALLEKSGL